MTWTVRVSLASLLQSNTPRSSVFEMLCCLTESSDDEWNAEFNVCLPRPPAQTKGTSEEYQCKDNGGRYRWEIVPEVVIAGVWLEDSHGLMYVVVVVVVCIGWL